MRNVCVAIGNSADVRLVPSLLRLMDDDAPDIRGAAIWALARLDPDRFEAEKTARMAEETDPGVVAEWEGAA